MTANQNGGGERKREGNITGTDEKSENKKFE